MAIVPLPPVLLAAVAAALLAIELARPLESTGIATLPPLSPRATAAAAAPVGDVGAELRTVLARPLFTAGRRPPEAVASSAGSTAAPRLSAILVGGGMRRAVFESGDKPIAVGVGGHAGPYTVVAIDTTVVTVGGADGAHRLRPTPLPDDGNGSGSNTAAPNPVSAPFTGTSLLEQLRRGGLPSGRLSPMQQLMSRLHRND